MPEREAVSKGEGPIIGIAVAETMIAAATRCLAHPESGQGVRPQDLRVHHGSAVHPWKSASWLTSVAA